MTRTEEFIPYLVILKQIAIVILNCINFDCDIKLYKFRLLNPALVKLN